MRGPLYWARRARDAGAFVGVNPSQFLLVMRRSPRFLDDARRYARAAAGTAFPLRWRAIDPQLGDYTAQAGVARGHYFHQDLWAARRVFARRPAQHVDIGSRIDGFVAHVLTFMPVTVVDIRPLESDAEGLTFVCGDVCHLGGFRDASVESLSSLHAIEHVGLGRYGDPIDAHGWRTALTELARLLAPGGRLYLGAPVGRERVAFNSERVFAPRTIVEAVPTLRLLSFSAVTDDERFVAVADLDALAGARYSCGLFEFTK